MYHLFPLFFPFLYCCSITVVPISSPLHSSAHLPHSVSANPPPHCLCPWVLYTCSLITLPLLSCLIPILPSGHCQFVISMSLVLFCLLGCFVDQVTLLGEIIWYLSLPPGLLHLFPLKGQRSQSICSSTPTSYSPGTSSLSCTQTEQVLAARKNPQTKSHTCQPQLEVRLAMCGKGVCQVDKNKTPITSALFQHLYLSYPLLPHIKFTLPVTDSLR